MIELRGITRTFGGKGGVRDVDLAFGDGELVVIVGSSGCGKSTLLSLVAGLDEPESGGLWIDGRDARRRTPVERGVAMVFQSYALYPHLEVAKNIAFPLEIAGVPRDERDRRVRETAARLSIDHLLARKPAQLSGGERQRVALARAIVRRPRICLFDEPLSNLDPSLRAQMRVEILALHRELRATFVWVTHDPTEAMTLADRVVAMNEGRVRQCGPPGDLYARPADTFVASFFGAPPINLIQGERETLGVRPPEVRIAREGTHEGRVVMSEPLGADVFVTLDTARGRLTGRGHERFALGDRAFASWDRARELRFDAQGRARE